MLKLFIVMYLICFLGRNSSHVEETFDASEDEKSLLNSKCSDVLVHNLIIKNKLHFFIFSLLV